MSITVRPSRSFWIAAMAIPLALFVSAALAQQPTATPPGFAVDPAWPAVPDK